MKQKKFIVFSLAVLLLLTACLTILHFKTRDSVPEGMLMVNASGGTAYVKVDEIPTEPISCTVTNRKGNVKSVNSRGFALFSLADDCVQAATVTADDAYHAEVGIEDADNAFLIFEEDGSLRLIVIGDSLADRDVKNVVKVDFR